MNFGISLSSSTDNPSGILICGPLTLWNNLEINTIMILNIFFLEIIIAVIIIAIIIMLAIIISYYNYIISYDYCNYNNYYKIIDSWVDKAGL